MGEVVTAVAESGLRLLLLDEEQGVKADDRGGRCCTASAGE